MSFAAPACGFRASECHDIYKAQQGGDLLELLVGSVGVSGAQSPGTPDHQSARHLNSSRLVYITRITDFIRSENRAGMGKVQHVASDYVTLATSTRNTVAAGLSIENKR